jgi:ribosomal protein S27AE
MIERIGRALSRLAGPRLPLEGSLEFCPSCGDDAFAALSWDSLCDRRWRVVLRCGSCGVQRARIVPDAEAKRLEDAIERGARTLAKAADKLDRELMAEWVETFSAGLRHDLIDVTDFAATRP